MIFFPDNFAITVIVVLDLQILHTEDCSKSNVPSFCPIIGKCGIMVLQREQGFHTGFQ